jgi:Ca-activated chloride channel family protein
MEEVKREGVDIVFAIDVSKSMLAEDVAPNRLEKSKQLVTRIISELGGDRVGIIGYAGSAFPQLPLTTDFNAARMFLNAMNTDMVSSQGTAIGEAINLARTFYREEEDETNKVLVIISDGEDHIGEVIPMATTAAEEGFRIVTVGVGTPSGGPIPIKRNGILLEYKRDQNNERVITRLEESTLKDIASSGNGVYMEGSNTSHVVEGLNTMLSELDKQEFDSKKYAGFKDQFQWFLAAAIFFLLLDVFVLEKKTRWVQKLNLFNEKKNE